MHRREPAEAPSDDSDAVTKHAPGLAALPGFLQGPEIPAGRRGEEAAPWAEAEERPRRGGGPGVFVRMN